MTARARRLWRPRAAVAGVLEDAGRVVADAIKTTHTSGARLAVLGLAAGLVIGAGLVWLGVSIRRQAG